MYSAAIISIIKFLYYIVIFPHWVKSFTRDSWNELADYLPADGTIFLSIREKTSSARRANVTFRSRRIFSCFRWKMSQRNKANSVFTPVKPSKAYYMLFRTAKEDIKGLDIICWLNWNATFSFSSISIAQTQTDEMKIIKINYKEINVISFKKWVNKWN